MGALALNQQEFRARTIENRKLDTVSYSNVSRMHLLAIRLRQKELRNGKASGIFRIHSTATNRFGEEHTNGQLHANCIEAASIHG